MSDGNFNTKLLAPGGYASGVRAGEARMKQRALKIFTELASETFGESSSMTEQLQHTFKKRLDESPHVK